MLKQMETYTESVGGVNYYITPFPAFKAANLSGKLASIISPIFSAIAPLFRSTDDSKEKKDFFDEDANKFVESINGSIDIDGDKLESLMKDLLLGGHIAVELEDDGGEKSIEKLTKEIADEVFCGEVQDMYVLCFHVIKINFSGFFKKLASQSGKAALSKASKRRIV